MRTNTKIEKRTMLMSAILLAASSMFVGACGGVGDERDDRVEAEASNSSGSLTLETATPILVSGTFRKNGAMITFELRRDGNVEHAIVRTAAHEPLVESIIRADGTHTTKLFGNRLLVEGSTEGGAGAPTYSGDRAAEADLKTIPEAQSLSGLERALVRASSGATNETTDIRFAAAGGGPWYAGILRMLSRNDNDTASGNGTIGVRG